MERKPEWLRKPYTPPPEDNATAGLLRELGLNTVCREADCPNAGECFAARTATFMILGTTCTRDCRFCNVSHGAPDAIDESEPERVAEAVARLGLRYVVVTSVTRDDLPDGGAEHFARTVRAIHAVSPDTAIETLIPDFAGNFDALAAVAASEPSVISHNMETVKPLYSEVRPQAGYRRSLDLLAAIPKCNPRVRSKSGVMLGLGETSEQLIALLSDMRTADCEFLTLGQYLAPSKRHLPVRAYVTPDEFDSYGEIARNMGFSFVASAPFVRSSYHAGEALAQAT
ncbi:lipoyl synthase [Clostridia bacterium]|nr:lipoyl synthase [Clostridia bacterium]